MPPQGGRSEEAQATVTKNTGLRQVARRSMGADACPVPEGYGSWLVSTKLATEAPVNGGRNYNGPKVAKFLVG